MKKFIAGISLAAITTMGAFGVIGLGAASASAAPADGPAQTAICNTLGTDATAATAALAAANAAQALTATAFGTAQSVLTTALGVYAAEASIVVSLTDSGLPGLSAAESLLKSDSASFVNTVVSWSSAKAAESNAASIVSTDTLSSTTINTLDNVICGTSLPV